MNTFMKNIFAGKNLSVSIDNKPARLSLAGLTISAFICLVLMAATTASAKTPHLQDGEG